MSKAFHRLALAGAVAGATLLAGCGVSGAPVTGTSAASLSAQAESLFRHMPKDRDLTPAERDNTFGTFLDLATTEALKWDKDARLVVARAGDVDDKGRRQIKGNFSYRFRAGLLGVMVVKVRGNRLEFDRDYLEGLHWPVFGRQKMAGDVIPASKAIAAARSTKALKAASLDLVLIQPKDYTAPIYAVKERKLLIDTAVYVNAVTGELLTKAQRPLINVKDVSDMEAADEAN